MAEQVIVCMRSLPQGTAREVSALGHRLAWRALGLLLGRAEQQLFESGVRLAKEESGRPVWTGTDCFVLDQPHRDDSGSGGQPGANRHRSRACWAAESAGGAQNVYRE